MSEPMKGLNELLTAGLIGEWDARHCRDLAQHEGVHQASITLDVSRPFSPFEVTYEDANGTQYGLRGVIAGAVAAELLFRIGRRERL